MLPNLSTQSHPWLLLLMPLLAFVFALLLWVLLVYAVSKCFRDDDPRRLKTAIALTIIAVMFPGLWVRGWSDLLLFGALGVMIASLTFGLVYVLPGARAARPAERERFDGLKEICLASVTAGFALSLASAVVNILRFDAQPRNLALNLGVAALMLWQSGFWLGRASLHLRGRIDDGASLGREAWER
jgi:hypothetical protein